MQPVGSETCIEGESCLQTLIQVSHRHKYTVREGTVHLESTETEIDYAFFF
jgi:hypothetical protein